MTIEAQQIVDKLKVKIYTKEEMREITSNLFNGDFNLVETLEITEHISYFSIIEFDKAKEVGQEKVLTSIKVNLTPKLIEFDKENNNGYDRAIWMAVLIAVKLNYIEVFKYLVSYIDIKDMPMDEGLFLAYALDYEHFEIAEYIINNTPSNYGNTGSYPLSNTILDKAIQCDNTTITELLSSKYEWFSLSDN